MTQPPDITLLRMLPAVVLGAAAAVAVIWSAAHLVRYLRTDRALRPVLRTAWRIKRTWHRTARRVGLVQTEQTRPPWWSNTPATTVITRELVPAITVAVRPWGVQIDARTVGRMGLERFQDVSAHLADAWRVPQVRAEQPRPGLIRLRALLTDPLTQTSQWAQDATCPADPATWLAGIDADGQPVTIRSAGVSGVVVPAWPATARRRSSMPGSANSPRHRRCSSC